MARTLNDRPQQNPRLRDVVKVAKAYQISPFDEARDQKYKDNVVHRKSIVAKFVLPAGEEFGFNEAKGQVPAYWHVRIGGTNLHLRDGLVPGQEVIGLVEVSLRQTKPEKPRAGFEPRSYIAVNLYPTDGPATHELLLDQPALGAIVVDVDDKHGRFVVTTETDRARIVPIGSGGSVDFDGEEDTVVPTGDEPLDLGGESG